MTTGQTLVAHIGLLLVSAGFLLPFIWMLSTSLKTLDKTMEFPPRFIPDRVELWQVGGTTTPIPKNYVDVVTSPKVDFPRLTRNTLIIAGMSVLGTTISSALVAYGFARIRFKGRGLMFAVMLSTMMIPLFLTVIPRYVIVSWLHLQNSYAGMILPFACSAFGRCNASPGG